MELRLSESSREKTPGDNREWVAREAREWQNPLVDLVVNALTAPGSLAYMEVDTTVTSESDMCAQDAHCDKIFETEALVESQDS